MEDTPVNNAGEESLATQDGLWIHWTMFDSVIPQVMGFGDGTMDGRKSYPSG